MLRQLILAYFLVRPGDLVWDVDRATAELDHRDDVRAQRVADHHELLGLDPSALKDSPVGLLVFLADDLDAEKEVAKTRARELALLVEQVALGDEKQVVPDAQGAKRFFDAVEQLGRLHQHSLAPAEDH